MRRKSCAGDEVAREAALDACWEGGYVGVCEAPVAPDYLGGVVRMVGFVVEGKDRVWGA